MSGRQVRYNVTSAFLANAEKASATQILTIPADQPERIFPRDADGIARLRKDLLKIWHPDRNPDAKAGDVFHHINTLADAAKDKLDNGVWSVEGRLDISTADGKGIKIQYLRKHDFELGECYISTRKVTYVVRGAYADLFDNAVKQIQNFKFANDKMKAGFETYLPKIFKTLEAKNGDRVLIVEKEPDAVSLRDCFNYASDHGGIDPRHVGWIMSRLHNFTAYLQWAGLTHNAISLDTCFILPKDSSFDRSKGKIAPKDHALSVLGGWWYAAKVDQPLLGLPADALKYVPRNVLASGRADPQIDRTMVRVAGRELLGDVTGVRLARDGKTPKAMADWLAMPGSGDAISDFATWRDKILTDSFGARKFVELNVGPNEVYALKP